MSGGLPLRHSPAGWTIFSAAFLTLLFVVPGTVGAPIWDSYASTTWWSFAVLLVAALELARLLAGGLDRIVSAIFWVYVYVFLGVAPMAQQQARHLPLGGFESYRPSQLIGASIVVLVGLAAYKAGRLGGRVSDRRRGPLAVQFSRQLDLRRVRIVGLISLPVTVAVLLSLHDPLAIIKSQDALSKASADTVAASAIQMALLTTPVFMALLFLLGSRGSRASRYTPLVVALVIANVAVNNPIANNRTWFGTVAFALGASRISLSRTQFRFALAGLLVFFTVVFPHADVFRFDDRPAQVVYDDPLVSKGDYDSFQQIANGIDRVTDEGFTMGSQIAGSALFWVPRSVWPGKPIDTGVRIAEHHGYEYTNLSAPLWIEGFTDFGVIGVVCLLYAFGRVSERLERAWLLRRLSGSQLVGLAVPALAAYQMILLRGSLLQACGRLAVMVLITLYCCPTRANGVATVRRHGAAVGAAPDGCG